MATFFPHLLHLPLSIYVSPSFTLLLPSPPFPISCLLCVRRQLPDLLPAVLPLLKQPRRFYKHWKVYPRLWRLVGWCTHRHTHTHTHHTHTHTRVEHYFFLIPFTLY